MSDQPETLAAILAEMRDLADRRAADAGGERPGIELLRSYADRIEAAAERERDEDRQLAAIAESDEAFARCARCDRPELAPGNAAAMREALEVIANEIRIWRASIVGITPDERRLLNVARCALSAPARNCDRPECADVESAWATYCAETNRADCKGFARWLFARAEGGDHA